MSSIAIITARGGSKRIPKKNIKDFCGKPIIAYSIEAALESKLFDEVMVSTDSEEIADVARRYGASVPFMRSETTSNDFAGTVDVLIEVINEYIKRGKSFDNVLCIYPTAPFVTAEKLIKSYELLKPKDVYEVMPVISFSFPPQRGLKKVGTFVIPAYPEDIGKRSQDLESIYHDCGQFYWYKTNELMGHRDILIEHIAPFELSEVEVQDIDNYSDWELAEIKFKYMISKLEA